MNKGYAIGFLIILLVLVLGLYVAFTGFVSSREAMRAQSPAVPDIGVDQATSPPTSLPTEPTATELVIPTPLPGITATLTAVALPSPAESAATSELAAPTEPPIVPPTEAPPAQPTNTPSAVAQPPTPVPAPAYQFRLAGPPVADPTYPICCYIFGTVRDANGNALEGVLVQASNEWNELAPAPTKGGGEAGQYNIPIGRDVVAWYLMVVDAGGNVISSQVQIQFDPNVANGYRVDWQRTY